MARLLTFWSSRDRGRSRDDDPLRLARAPRPRGDRRDADGAWRGARRARRSRVDDRRARHRGAAMDRGADVRRRRSTSAAAASTCVDDQAVRYGDFDDIAIVGVVEPDWPERPRRNIFYPPALLKALGWPSEKDRRARRRRAVPRSAASASRRTLGLDLHARRRSARRAVDAARRDPARAAVDGAPARRSTTRASSSTRRCRSSRSRSIRSTGEARDVGGAADRTVAGGCARLSRHACATRRSRAWSVSAHRDVSRTVRSSSSRSTCCSSRRSPTTKK